MKNISLP